jgi:hypothetical protein
VRNHLHGLAEIIATPLLQNHCLVNLPAGQVVMPGEDAVGEALVVTEIKISLRTVVENINLAVLERVHCPGIDIQVGIKLLENNPQPTCFEQRAERGCRQSLA